MVTTARLQKLEVAWTLCPHEEKAPNTHCLSAQQPCLGVKPGLETQMAPLGCGGTKEPFAT